MFKGNDMQQKTIDWSKIRFESTMPGKTNVKFFEFPTQFMREQFQKTKEDVWLSGFFINSENGGVQGEVHFHFVLSNNWTTYKSVQGQQKKDKQKGVKKVDYGGYKLFQMTEECKSPQTIKIYLSKKQGQMKGIAFNDNN